MSATEIQFRGAAFGGFNRKDVLAYVENTFAEHSRQVENLKKELELAEEKNGEQTAELDKAKESLSQYAEQNSRLTAELSAAQSRLSDQTDALSQARSELVSLREKVKTLEPGAEAYARIKDLASSIELEAHMRAQNIVREAEARAETSRARAGEWLHRIQEDYDRLRTDVDATVSHASGELGRIQKTLGGITADFSVHDDALTDMLDDLSAELPAQAPKPAAAGTK